MAYSNVFRPVLLASLSVIVVGKKTDLAPCIVSIALDCAATALV